MPSQTELETALGIRRTDLMAATVTRHGRRANTLLFFRSVGEGRSIVVKAPIYGEGRAAIANEVSALRALQKDHAIANHVPRLLYPSDGSSDAGVVAMSYEEGVRVDDLMQGSRRQGLRAIEAVAGVLRMLWLGRSMEDKGEQGGGEEEDAVGGLVEAIVAVSPGSAPIFDDVRRVLADSKFLRGRTHGDLVPKNLLLTGGGCAKILDWEFFNSNGFPIVDAFDLGLVLASRDFGSAGFHLAERVWGSKVKTQVLLSWLRILRPTLDDDLTLVDWRSLMLMYLTWCAWRYASAEWSSAVVKCEKAAAIVLGRASVA